MSQLDSLADLRKIKLPFNIDKVEDQCIDCVRAQLKKYDNYTDEFGVSYRGKFTVPCKGILKTIDSPLKAAFSKEEWEDLEAANNISLWAEKFLVLPNGQKWIPRWYQKEVLSCTSTRKCLRISRRSGKTDMAVVEILYSIFTNTNLKVVIAGPQKNHAEEIINRIRAFLQANPLLQECVKRDVSAPYYEILLTNGSRVRGFAAGAKGGSGGIGIRGQDADKIYIEEAAYVDEKAMTGAILPILQTTPNTTLVAFSTPNAFLTTYRKFCEQDPQYKEFHYTYKVLPHWKNVEADRAAFTLEEWQCEFLALFGDTSEGVYKAGDIDKSLSSYLYSSCSPNLRWKYVLGADWNEKHGAEIVVLGFNPYSGRFKVVDACVIEKAEFTQLASVDKVIEMNRKWQPNFLYVDSGNGSTNIELLMKISNDNRIKKGDPNKARIMDILKAYDSGAAIETKDVITREKKKVPAKRFMVNASIRMFENHQIEISANDKVLEDQLRNYIIARISPNGNPVYGVLQPRIGDHRLDALNLAIVGFQLEFSDLYKETPVNIQMGAAPDPRTGSQSVNYRKDLQTEEDNPADRRLESTDTDRERLETAIYGASMTSTYGRGMSNRKSRIGPDNTGKDDDTDHLYRDKCLQNKRNRSKVRQDRPKRSTF